MVDVLKFLDIYRRLGEAKLENGAYLIGKAPHIAPKAWLHSIYAGLNSNELKELETMLGKPIPDCYKSFLMNTNGLNIFNTTFCLYGLRRNYNRGIDDARQPFDIKTPNIAERPENAAGSFFFIGGYDWDGSLLYIDINTEKVHFCQRENAASLYDWNSFDDMLESEITRLIKLFDSQGKELDSSVSTLPIL